MNRKTKQIVTKLAVYGVLLYTAVSCIMGIGSFGVYLNEQIIDKLGALRFAAAAMAMWMMYVYGKRKKQLFKWLYAAITIIFIGAVLSTIQPGAFGTVSAGIVSYMPAPTERVQILIVWVMTAVLLIVPNTKNIKLDSVKGMITLPKFDTSQGFSFFVDVPGASQTASNDTGYKYIPFVQFGTLAQDSSFMKNKHTFPVGQMENGRPLYAELSDDTPHFLIAGMTGSGKTILLQIIAAALAYKNLPEDLQLILIDGVRRGLRPLEKLPHVKGGVISEDEDVIKVLEYVYTQVRARIQNDINKPKIVTIIDEADGYFGDPKLKKQIEPLVSYIVKKGRQFGIHLIIGSQRPSGDLVSPHILSQIERICLKVRLPKYSENIIESPDGSALTGKGDLLYLSNNGLVHARSYYMDEKGKQEVSKFAQGVASMYPTSQRILEADAADAEGTSVDDDVINSECMDPDDEIDLFIPGKKVTRCYGTGYDVTTSNKGSVTGRNAAIFTFPGNVTSVTEDVTDTQNDCFRGDTHTYIDSVTVTPDDIIGAEIVRLHDVEKLSYQKIADRLGYKYKIQVSRIYDEYKNRKAE